MNFKRIKAWAVTAILAGSMAAGSFSAPVFAADSTQSQTEASEKTESKETGVQAADSKTETDSATVTLDDGTTITCPDGWDSDDPQWVKEYLKLYKPEALADSSSASSSSSGTLSGKMTAFASYTKTTWKKYSSSGLTTTAYHDSRNTTGNELYPLIDVSKWEGSINWDKVKADGIDYVLIRVGYQGASNGSLNDDPYYKTYIKGALAAGLKVGVYIYSQAISQTEAVEQADYILDRISSYDIELPVIFDYEYYTSTSGRLYKAHLSKAKKTEICEAFCDEVSARGYDAMLYAGSSFLKLDMNGADFAESYPIWAARYNTYLYSGSASNFYQGSVEMWQNSDNAKIAGINHAVDLNYWYKDPDWESGNPGYDGKKDNNKESENPYASTGTSLKKSSADAESVTVSWDAVSDATGYIVSMSDAYDGTYEEISLGSDATSYKFSNLNAGQEYYFRIQPVQNDYKGKKSSTLSVMTSGAASGLRLKTTANELNMRSHAGTSSVCKKIKTLKKGTIVTFKGQTRSPSGSVWYKVKSGSKTGYISAAYANYYVEPVTDLKQSGSSSTKIKLTWTASQDATSYYIYRSSALNGTYKKLAEKKKTSYTDKSVQPGTIYYYKVGAVKKVNDQVLKSTSGAVTLYAASVDSFMVKTIKETPLRKAAGDSYKKLVTIPKSKKFTITYTTADKNNTPWYEVTYKKSGKSYTGYIKSSYVKKV